VSIRVVLQPDAAEGVDTFLSSVPYADTNFGDAEFEGVGLRHIGKVAYYTRLIARFDLNAIPLGATILGAALTFSVAADSAAEGALFSAYRLTRSDWTEFGATWNKVDGSQSWSAPGGDYASEGHDETTVPADVEELAFESLAELAADALANRGGMLHLLVVGPESGGGGNALYLYSSDAAEAELRPRLEVDYEVPMPQLTLTDHADGSGATATITGSAPGSSNTVYVQSFSGDLGGGGWNVGGTRSGDGEVELALAVGHYFACCVSALGQAQVTSAVSYFLVTDGQESIHTRCLLAAQARIRLLGLEGVANDSVVIEKVAAGRNLGAQVALPAVVLSPHRAAMPAAAGTNSLDDVHYDALVAIFDRDNQEPTLAANLDRHLLRRQQIARAFRNQRLAGVPEVINAEVEPAEGLLDEAWKRELMASAVLLRFTSRESRGFN
jgi:hypothetical protein